MFLQANLGTVSTRLTMNCWLLNTEDEYEDDDEYETKGLCLTS